jgi:hypothetical protein
MQGTAQVGSNKSSGRSTAVNPTELLLLTHPPSGTCVKQTPACLGPLPHTGGGPAYTCDPRQQHHQVLISGCSLIFRAQRTATY